MKLRRMAMIAGGTLAVALAGGAYVAERSGVDLTLFVDRLIARVSLPGEAERAEPNAADDHASEDVSARKPVVKGDRLVPADEEALADARPDAQDMRQSKAAHGAGEAGEEPTSAARHAASEGGHGGAADGAPSHEAAANQEGHGEKPAETHAANGSKGHASGGHASKGQDAGAHEGGAPEWFDAQAHRLPPGELQPWRVFRRLQRVQDRIVAGEPGSLQAYREAMAHAAQEMMALPAETWRHERNVMSAAAYVLAGGRPELARHVLGMPGISADARRLLEGAHAYAMGKYYNAYNLLYEVHPELLPVSIAGQVALVKAMLMSPRDLDRATTYLAMARRMAPGTLVEEAALRRIIRIKAEAGAVDDFFRAARSYARRFPNSVFLSDFLRNFAFGSLRFPDQHAERLATEVEAIAAQVDPAARLFMFSLLARGATVFGKFDLAREVSGRSLELVQDDPRLEQRLRLYHAASSLTRSELVEEAGSQLDGIDRDVLDVNDARLLEAARMVAGKIREPLQAASLDLPDIPAPQANADEAANSGAGGHTDPMTVSNVGSEPLSATLTRSRSMLFSAKQALDW